MFGRIRSSPLSAESLELERPPSKFFKQDSLSIYEATLAKLKQGSQRSTASEHDLSPVSHDSMEFESNSTASEGSPTVHGLCSSEGLATASCIGVLSSPDQGKEKGREISIHYLFSKYASSHHKQGSSSYNSGSCSSVNNSGCSSDSELSTCS